MCVCFKTYSPPNSSFREAVFSDNLYRRMKSRRESHSSYHCGVFFTSSGKRKQGSEDKGVHLGMASLLKPGQERAKFTGQL